MTQFFVCFNFVFSFFGTICVIKRVPCRLRAGCVLRAGALCVMKRRAMPFRSFLATDIGTHIAPLSFSRRVLRRFMMMN